jgi:hypothetical protein
MGEYQLTHPDGGYSVLYHCPWCGGANPRSKRATRFATISVREAVRLQRLTAGLRTVDQAVAALGLPDVDEPHGTIIKTWKTERRASTEAAYRTLTFQQLSKVADVVLTDMGPLGVTVSWHGKYIGTKSRRASARRIPLKSLRQALKQR